MRHVSHVTTLYDSRSRTHTLYNRSRLPEKSSESRDRSCSRGCSRILEIRLGVVRVTFCSRYEILLNNITCITIELQDAASQNLLIVLTTRRLYRISAKVM